MFISWCYKSNLIYSFFSYCLFTLSTAQVKELDLWKYSYLYMPDINDIKNDELKEIVGGGLLPSNQKFSKGDWVKIKGDISSLTAYRIKRIIEEDDNTKCELIRYK